MKITQQTAVREVLAHMETWLQISPRIYTPNVHLFALRLPPEKLIEALWVAQTRIPEGDLGAFKYFCGVCHRMIREQSGQLSGN